jgi:hypothetical protein
MNAHVNLRNIGVRIEVDRFLPPGRWKIIGRDGKAIPIVLGADGKALGPPIPPERIERVVCAPDVFEAAMKMRAHHERAQREPPLALKATRQ